MRLLALLVIQNTIHAKYNVRYIYLDNITTVILISAVVALCRVTKS